MIINLQVLLIFKKKHFITKNMVLFIDTFQRMENHRLF